VKRNTDCLNNYDRSTAEVFTGTADLIN